MTRETLDRKLNELRDGVLILGSMVEQATLEAVDSLKRQDIETARRYTWTMKKSTTNALNSNGIA
jgi:hypothetical protein